MFKRQNMGGLTSDGVDMRGDGMRGGTGFMSGDMGGGMRMLAKSDWEIDEDDVRAAIWGAIFSMWGMVGTRIFYSVVMFKFCKEGYWLKSGGGRKDQQDSHPCRQTM